MLCWNPIVNPHHKLLALAPRHNVAIESNCDPLKPPLEQSSVVAAYVYHLLLVLATLCHERISISVTVLYLVTALAKLVVVRPIPTYRHINKLKQLNTSYTVHIQ